METETSAVESFRDSISTVNKEGKRVWVYPRKQKGQFYTARTAISIFLLIILFGIPFLKVNGHPFILLDILKRKFILFGLAFGPHDFYLFGIAMLILVVFIILFTAVYGRLFCGWICPQTVFMEMVFRKIEYWIEGDAPRQRMLNKAPWTGGKIFKKLSKHSIFFGLSFLISNIFLAYIIGSDELLIIITDSPSKHLSGLIAILIFSGIFYWIYARFREQVCIIVCPYGRLQGVLLDTNSIVVAYDFVRGEPRTKFKKSEERTGGDCIDCHFCVDVCPTGIDIRNGTQLECINCTSCIDACNDIMDRVDLPRNLIRYDSLQGIKEKRKRKFTPRIVIYSVLLFVLLTVFILLLANRSDIEASVLRTPGLIYQEQPDNKLSNLYNIKLVNKTFDEIPITLKLYNKEAELKIAKSDIVVPPQGVYEEDFFIILPKDKISPENRILTIQIYSGDRLIDEFKTSFLAPKKKSN